MTLPLVRLTVQRVIATSAVVAILLGSVFCLISNALTGLQIAFADDQTAVFDEMRERTAASASVDVSYLEYVL